MKLRRLRIESFKCFRDSLEVEGLTDGLNLFAAPNEAGKSTIAEAIRAAFFERHRSGSVEHLRPWTDASATPTVEVEFEIDGQRHVLNKAFLGRKRCTLEIEGRSTLDGTAAEDHVAQLLGFKFPGKGASSAEHMGIPGLLWIRQGGAPELASAVQHAADHLRNVLGETLGELTSTGGDIVLQAVEAERNALLTPATGKPRGDYAIALERQAELSVSLDALNSHVATYHQRVDRLDSLRRDHQRDQQSQPWLALREQCVSAQNKLAEAQSLAGKQQEAKARLEQLQAQANALRSELEAYARDETTLTTRTQAVNNAKAVVESTQIELKAQQQRHQEAAQAEVRAHQQRERVRALAQRNDLDTNIAELVSTLATQTTTLQQARDAHERATRQRIDAESMQIASADLDTLKQLTESLRDLDVRLTAAATALEFDLLDGQSICIDDEQIIGRTQRTAIRATTIDIPDVGRIMITPGIADLDTLTLQRERLSAERDALLHRLGVADLAAAQERARQAAQRLQDAKASEQLLQVLAPQGVEALASELASREARLDDLRRQRDALPAAGDDDAGLPPLANVESEIRRATRLLEAMAQARDDARIAAAKAQSEFATAEQELLAATATLKDPLRTQRIATATPSLTDTLAQQTTAQKNSDALATQLKSANLELLKQDVERLDRSARQLEDAHAARQRDILQLEAELHVQGALGLEEQRAEQQRELEAIGRRADELARRADALDYLLGLLRDKRADLARRLRAPLQKHLDRNLDLLFPGARIEIADNLSPGPITRHGTHGNETGDFEHLSLGTREQMGIIARLSYADLLQEAGKPTLLILDDALVNTDETRLGQMKRVLYDAAQRHQILIFTCHPAAWRDLGVVARVVEG